MIDDGVDEPLAEALELEADAFVSVFDTEDARLGVDVLPRARPRPGPVRRALSAAGASR